MISGLRWTSVICPAAMATLALVATIVPDLAQTAPEWKCTLNPEISWDEVITECTSAINSGKYVGKDAAWAYNVRGTAYFFKGDNDRAIADYNEAIRLDPKYAFAYNGRGNAWQDNDRAIADYNEAIRLDPKYSRAYSNRGNAYQAKGDNDRAIADYSEAIRLDPKNVFAYNGRGNAHKDRGDSDRAIADYNEAVRLDPKFALSYFGRGAAYKARGDNDRAIADYNAAIRLNPKYAFAYYGRGDAYQAKGDNDRAIADYSEMIRISPKDPNAFFSRGRANLYSGALPKALADLNQASDLNPKYAYPALWLDIVNKRSNLPSGLAEATTQIDMTKWPAPIIRLYLGQLTPEDLLAAANDPDAKTKNGQVCEANFYSGELALQRGDKAEATRLFRQAGEDCPKSFVEYEGATAELKTLEATP
jgi:tetratricopeptide (TPR) repeat protein